MPRRLRGGLSGIHRGPGARNAVTGAVRAWSSRQWSLQDPIDEFFAAVDAWDAAASKHIGRGENMTRVHNLVPVVCQGINYYCSFSCTTKDEAGEGNMGVTRVVFVTEKVQANDAFRQELQTEDGLTVIEDCPGSCETRRIGNSPYIFTPVDRTITQEDLTAFLAAEDRREAFTPGPARPTRKDGAACTMSWPRRTARCVHIYTRDFGDETKRVSAIYLYNDRDYAPMETIREHGPASGANETEDST